MVDALTEYTVMTLKVSGQAWYVFLVQLALAYCIFYQVAKIAGLTWRWFRR